jgi:DNA repair exonuclease SbcCD ATPase subunit
MSDDPRATLAETLTRSGPAAALEALDHAAQWAAQALPAEVGDDDVAAFECVVALDQALAHVAALLRLLPDLLRTASAGQAISDRLAAARAELERQRVALAGEHDTLAQARDLEQRAGQLRAERDAATARIAELRQASVIERELPALRARQADLEAAISPAAAAEGAQAVAGLVAAARHVLDLTGEQKALVEAANHRLITALAEATEAASRERGRHEELTAQLADAEREAEELAAQRRQVLPALRARQEADSALAAGLDAGGLPAGDSAASRVREELADTERRIAVAEDLLRPLLLRHAEAYEEARKVRGWTS